MQYFQPSTPIYKALGALVGFLLFSCKKETITQTNDLPWRQSSPFVQVFGGSANESARAVVATPDGGFAVLGHTQSQDGFLAEKTNNSFDMWLLRFDGGGNLLWQKTYGGPGNDRGLDLINTPTGNLVLVGFLEGKAPGAPTSPNSQNLWVVQVDAVGTVQWEKTFGYAGSDYATQVIADADGNLVIAGVLDVTASEGLGNQTQKHAGGDYWVLKLNAQGELIWRNYFGGLQADTPYALETTPDGGYLLAGTSDSADTDISQSRGSYDCWVVKIDSQGQLQWEASFGGSQIDTAYALAPLQNGHYRIVGDSRSSDQQVTQNNGAADMWVFDIDLSGELVQEKCIGGSNFDVGRSLYPLSNGCWLLAGSSRSTDGDLQKNQGQNDAWMVVLNPTASEIIWQQTLGGAEVDFAYDAVQLSDGSLIAVGETQSQSGDIPINFGFTDALILLNPVQ